MSILEGYNGKYGFKWTDLPYLKLSGLEPLVLGPNTNFVNVGERTKYLPESKKFLRSIKEEKFEEAISVAREQVEGGAQRLLISTWMKEC